MLNATALENISRVFTAAFLNAPPSYHDSKGNNQEWLKLKDHLWIPDTLADNFRMCRHIDVAQSQVRVVGNFSLNWTARSLVETLNESKKRITGTFKPATTEEKTLFFAVYADNITKISFARASGFILLDAKYKNVSVSSACWSNSAYVANPVEQATLRLVSPEELAEFLTSRPEWQKSIMFCLKSELSTMKHHHTCLLTQIEGGLGLLAAFTKDVA
jgi:hypothetical protein